MQKLLEILPENGIFFFLNLRGVDAASMLHCLRVCPTESL